MTAASHPLVGTVSPHVSVAVPTTLWAMPLFGGRSGLLRTTPCFAVVAVPEPVTIAEPGR